MIKLQDYILQLQLMKYLTQNEQRQRQNLLCTFDYLQMMKQKQVKINL